MANNAVRTADLAQMNSATGDDTLIITRASNGQTRAITVENLFGNSDIAVFKLPTGSAPANSTANTSIPSGQMFFDSNYLYVTTGTEGNTIIKRVSLSTY